MWILKGSLLGTGLFLVGTVFFLISALGPLRANTAIALSAITGYTIHNPLFWVAFLASLMLGCAIVGSWPVAAR
jgi:uncharacterized membrane protein